MQNNPIIIIPGIFGSMGNDIIPGTGEFDFGMAEYAYRPLIKNLESMGYKEGRDLFISHYDWTKSNVYSAQKYLIPVIKKAKISTGKHKVNLICHSMGGIVARSYIQTKLYEYDVKKMIMIGTPNCGAVNSYSFWSGGVLPYEKIQENVFYRLLREGFLWLFKIKYRKKTEIEIIRELFPAGQELLPSYEYGDYLIVKEKDMENKIIPIKQMSIRNELLNKLNKRIYLRNLYGISIYLIIGTGKQTNDYIYVDRTNRSDLKWHDGRPLNFVKTLYGDGTVTCKSAGAFPGRMKYLNSDHTSILSDSGEVLAGILKRRFVKEYRYLNNNEMQIYSILVDNVSNINITFNNKLLTINSDINIKNDRYIIRKVDVNTYWIMIRTTTKSKIEIKIVPQKNEKSNLLVLRGEGNNTISTLKQGIIVDEVSLNFL